MTRHPLDIERIAARAQLVRTHSQNDARPVPSPCISVCEIDPASGWCLGCWRTVDEVAMWSTLDPAGKRAVWQRIEERMA